jgi:predicted transposase/invertase (TIGR01784 family)
VVLANEQTGRIRLKQIYVSFERFDLRYEECVTPLEKTIYVLKNMETLKRLPFKARKSVFEKLEKIVDIASLSKEERMKYDESIKVYRDNLVTLEFAEQKGRAEGKEETARNLKKMGVSLEIISKATGLSIEKIEAL